MCLHYVAEGTRLARPRITHPRIPSRKWSTAVHIQILFFFLPTKVSHFWNRFWIIGIRQQFSHLFDPIHNGCSLHIYSFVFDHDDHFYWCGHFYILDISSFFFLHWVSIYFAFSSLHLTTPDFENCWWHQFLWLNPVLGLHLSPVAFSPEPPQYYQCKNIHPVLHCWFFSHCLNKSPRHFLESFMSGRRSHDF